MTIELIKAAELRTTENGPGKQGRIGVLYQVQPTGEFYRWDGVKHVAVAGAGGGGGSVDAASVQAALSSDQPGGRAALGLGSAATQAASAFATAAQGTDAREWAADTVGQAEAEAGIATTRRAWTAQRVRQAIAAARPEVATWADLPAANSVTVGRTYTVLNTGWRVYSDGTNWRPANGQLLLAARYGPVASPIATLTGVTSGNFVLPVVPTAPAGMIPPQSSVLTFARVRRNSATSTAIVRARFGTANSTADGATSAVSTAATASFDVYLAGSAEFHSSTTEYMSGGGAGWNAGAATRSADVTTNVNTAAAMFVSIGVDSANASDSFSLVSYEVWWRG